MRWCNMVYCSCEPSNGYLDSRKEKIRKCGGVIVRLTAWINFGIRKGLRYKVNTYSWVLADISLYSSLIFMYVLLSSSFDSFATYSKTELGLYISTYFIINNLFATLFAEAVSEYDRCILDGTFSYYQLTPTGPLRSLILLNFNFPAMLSTPILLAINIYFVIRIAVSPIQVLIYYFAIILACGTMLFVFLSISALVLFGIRSAAISSAITQLFSIAEKPDRVFHPAFRKIFTFVIPAFIFSAIPSKIIFGTITITELLYLFFCPLFFYVLYHILEHIGCRYYQHSGF